MSGSILPSYAANAYLYGAPMQAQPVAQTGPSLINTLLGSPLVSRQSAESSAIDALLGIASNSGGQASDVGRGEPGAPGTANPASDIPNALSSFGAATGYGATPMGGIAGLASTFGNPAGLANVALGTMALGVARGLGVNTTRGVSGLMGAIADIGRGVMGMNPTQTPVDVEDLDLGRAMLGLVETGPEKGEESAFGMDPTFDPSEPSVAAQMAGSHGIGSDTPASEADPSGPGTGSTDSDTNSGGTGAKGGGLATPEGFKKFARGGVIALEGGGKVAVGPGGGLDDLIPTNIDGRRAAALSDGEFVIPADVVSMMGDGSSNAGARRLYDLVKQIREEKTGTSRQAGPLPVAQILKRTMS